MCGDVIAHHGGVSVVVCDRNSTQPITTKHKILFILKVENNVENKCINISSDSSSIMIKIISKATNKKLKYI